MPLTDNQNKYYEKQRERYISQKEFCYNKNQKMKFKFLKKIIMVQNVNIILLLRNQQKSLKVDLNAQVKIQKNILAFQYQLKKNMIILKQLHTK